MELSVQIANIHIDQSVETKHRAIEHVYQKSTEKSCPQSTFSSALVSVKCAISQDDFEGGRTFNETVCTAICGFFP